MKKKVIIDFFFHRFIELGQVRVMKARKLLDHNLLVAEIMTQLVAFKPDKASVKRRIESLIEREYLERDPADRRQYRYLA